MVCCASNLIIAAANTAFDFKMSEFMPIKSPEVNILKGLTVLSNMYIKKKGDIYTMILYTKKSSKTLDLKTKALQY